MKKLQFITGAIILIFTMQSSAQVNVNISIGSRPDWCHQYESQVQYIYMPEIECYYDVHSYTYIYYGPSGWIHSVYLPEYCHGYDMYNGYKVAIDYRGHTPYRYFDNHRVSYHRNHYRNYRQEYYNTNHHRRAYAQTNYHPRQNNNGNGNHGRGNGNGRRR